MEGGKKGRGERENGDEPEGAEGTLRLTGGIRELRFERTEEGRVNLGWNRLQEDYREKGLSGRGEWCQGTVIDAGANKGRCGNGVQGKGKRCMVRRKEEKSEGMLGLCEMKDGKEGNGERYRTLLKIRR